MRRAPLLLMSLIGVSFSPLLLADSLVVFSATANKGDIFVLPLAISGATDLYSFQFDLAFDPSILQLQSIAEGSFLSGKGPTFFISGAIDNMTGLAAFTADTLLAQVTGAAGNGTLASFVFLAVAAGTSAVTISNIILLDSGLNDIPFTATTGKATITAVPEPELKVLVVLAAGILVIFRCIAVLNRKRV